MNRLKGTPTEGSAEAAPLADELKLHKEELNLQNEELKRVQMELETSKAKYYELYDLAPVGYITLSPELFIKEANLAAAMLLGCEKNKLIGRALFVHLTRFPRSAIPSL